MVLRLLKASGTFQERLEKKKAVHSCTVQFVHVYLQASTVLKQTEIRFTCWVKYFCVQ